VKRPCWLLGHKAVCMDSGYGVCSCGAHQYWHWQRWEWPGLLRWPDYQMWWLWQRLKWWYERNFVRCIDCGKWERVFGRRVGEHRECAPF
jgi:hypothetical protein